MQYGQPQAQLTMEAMAQGPMTALVQMPQAPFIPQVNFPQPMSQDIVFLTTQVVNIITAKAQQSGARMFFFNQMSMNGWQNPDFAEMMEVIANNASMWLMGGNQFNGIADWASEALDKLITERMAENLRYWPSLSQTVDGNSLNIMSSISGKFQERRAEVVRFMQHNQIPPVWIGQYNPAQAVMNYPSVMQQQPQMGVRPGYGAVAMNPGMNPAYAGGRPVGMMSTGMSASGYMRPGQQVQQHQQQYRTPPMGTSSGLFVNANAGQQPSSMGHTANADANDAGEDRFARQMARQRAAREAQYQPHQQTSSFTAAATTQPVERYVPSAQDKALMAVGGWKNAMRTEEELVRGANPFPSDRELAQQRSTTVGDLGRGGGAELSSAGLKLSPQAAARVGAPVSTQTVQHSGEDLTPFEWRSIQLLPRGFSRHYVIGDVVAAKQGHVFYDGGTGAMSDHCIIGVDEEGMLTGYLPQLITAHHLTREPSLPEYREDPSGQRTRDHYEEFIHRIQESVRDAEDAAFVIVHERHRLTELEARIRQQHGDHAAAVPVELRPAQAVVTPSSLSAEQRAVFKTVLTPSNAATYHLFTQLGIPEVKAANEVVWESSEYQPYHPAYPRRTHKLQYLVFPDGTVYANVIPKTDSEKDSTMDEQAHRIGALPTQPTQVVAEPAPQPGVAATPEPDGAKIKIDFRDKESMNLSDDEAIAEATLRAFFKGRIIGATSGVRAVQTIGHPLVCPDAMTAQFYRDFLARLQTITDVEEMAQTIRDELVRPEHMLLRNYLDDILTDRLNEALTVNTRVGWTVTSFIDDIFDVIAEIRNDASLGDRLANLIKTKLAPSLHGVIDVLNENTCREFVESYLDSLDGDQSYPNRIVFVTKRVAITHLGVSYHDLEFSTGPQSGPFEIGESMTVLHEVAHQLFTSDEIKDDGVSVQYVILRDGIKLVLSKGWLGTDFYLGQVVRLIR